MQIHVNSFVKRQTKESEFSYYDGPWEDIVARVEKNFEKVMKGYRDGVVLVSIDPTNCYSAVCKLKKGDKLVGEYKSRKEGETPRKSIQVLGGQKTTAKAVDIVLYSSKVLAEDGDNELPPDEENWEIISLNARPTREPQPMSVGTLMANHFGADGGTATHLTDSEFVLALRECYEYWKDKALAQSTEKI